MVTPAECKSIPGVYDICLNGYCLQSAEVNDVLPYFQDKDQNHDCRVDEKDYNGDSMALARDFVSAKKWKDFSAKQFDDWTNVMTSVRNFLSIIDQFKQIPHKDGYGSQPYVGSYPRYEYEDTKWYAQVVPLFGAKGEKINSLGKKTCEKFKQFVPEDQFESVIEKLPKELQTTTRMYLSKYWNTVINEKNNNDSPFGETGWEIARKDSARFLCPGENCMVFFDLPCDY